MTKNQQHALQICAVALIPALGFVAVRCAISWLRSGEWQPIWIDGVFLAVLLPMFARLVHTKSGGWPDKHAQVAAAHQLHEPFSRLRARMLVGLLRPTRPNIPIGERIAAKLLGLFLYWVASYIGMALSAAVEMFIFGSQSDKWNSPDAFILVLLLLLALSPIAASGVAVSLLILPTVVTERAPKFQLASCGLGFLLAVLFPLFFVTMRQWR